MFYKFENGEWLSGNEIHFPDGTVLNSENKESKDGWEWMDISPMGNYGVHQVPENYDNNDLAFSQNVIINELSKFLHNENTSSTLEH